MGGSISPLSLGLLTMHICHVPSLHLQTLKNIVSGIRLFLDFPQSYIRQPLKWKPKQNEMKNEP